MYLPGETWKDISLTRNRFVHPRDTEDTENGLFDLPGDSIEYLRIQRGKYGITLGGQGDFV